MQRKGSVCFHNAADVKQNSFNDVSFFIHAGECEADKDHGEMINTLFKEEEALYVWWL